MITEERERIHTTNNSNQTLSATNELGVTSLEPAILEKLQNPSENGSRRNLDRSIAKRRPYLAALNEGLARLNEIYPKQWTQSGFRKSGNYGEDFEIRRLILKQKRAISSAQARDRRTVRQLYVKS